MPLMALSLLRKAGPYIVIGILGVYAYIAHLKLVDCQAHNQMITLANHQMEAGIEAQNKAVSAEWKKTESLKSLIQSQNQSLSLQTEKMNRKVQTILAHPFKGTCDQSIRWFVNQTKGMK